MEPKSIFLCAESDICLLEWGAGGASLTGQSGFLMSLRGATVVFQPLSQTT